MYSLIRNNPIEPVKVTTPMEYKPVIASTAPTHPLPMQHPLTSSIASLDPSRPKPTVEFNHAINYVNKIKVPFLLTPEPFRW